MVTQQHRESVALRIADRKGPLTLAWRVANPITGMGPYRSGWFGPTHDASNNLFDAHNTSNSHPGWREDAIRRDEGLFGFDSAVKAQAWFDENQARLFERAGYALILLVTVRQWVKSGLSGKQMVFRADKSQALETMSPVRLHTDRVLVVERAWQEAFLKANVSVLPAPERSVKEHEDHGSNPFSW